MRPPLWKHQEEGIARGLDYARYGYFLEVGVGKSRIICELFNKRCHNKFQRCIIFCPPVVIRNWQNELKKYSDQIINNQVVPLVGSGNLRVKTFRQWKYKGHGFLCITNYELLLMDELFGEFKAWKPDILVFRS